MPFVLLLPPQTVEQVHNPHPVCRAILAPIVPDGAASAGSPAVGLTGIVRVSHPAPQSVRLGLPLACGRVALWS